MHRSSPRARRAIVIGGILLVGAAARFNGIGAKSYWFDEGVTLGMIRLPLGEFVRHAWDPSLNNQILYYVVLRPWHVFGESETALRSFSAIVSIATIAAVYALGRRLFGGTAGALAAAWLALHPWDVRYAQEARAYGLAALLVTLSALFLTRYLESRARRDLAGWIITGGCALYAHFFAGLAIAAQIAALAALGLRGLRERKALIAGALGLAALEAPIAYFVLTVPKALVDWVPPLTASSIVYVATILAGGAWALLILALASLAVAAAAALRSRSASKVWGAAMILSWALLPMLIMVMVSLFRPILVERYVLMSVPAFALAFGVALGWVKERVRYGAIAAAAVLIVVACLDAWGLRTAVYVNPYEDWRGIAADVSAATLPGDAIVYDSSWGGLTLGYYLEQSARRPEPLQHGWMLFDGDFDVAEAVRHDRLWVVLSRDDKQRTAELLLRLSRSHPVMAGVKYAGGEVMVVLADKVWRLHGSGAFGY